MNHKWLNESASDKYLNIVDTIFERTFKTKSHVVLFIKNPSDIKTKTLFKITTGILILVLVIFFASCYSPEKRRISNNPRNNYFPVQDKLNSALYSKDFVLPKSLNQTKQNEQLFIHREDILIRQKDIGSETGSIWADSQKPKHLLTENRATAPGDKVNIMIGPDLLMDTPNATPTTGQNSNAQASGGQTEKKPQIFPMQVAAIDKNGDIFLKGSKIKKDSSGTAAKVELLAKINRKDLAGEFIKAEDLHQIYISSEDDGNSDEYSTLGWDKTVSSILNSTATNSKEELAKLKADKAQMESEKKEVTTQKQALADGRKALEADTDRIRKDRDRANTEMEKSKKALEEALAVQAQIEKYTEEKKVFEEDKKTFEEEKKVFAEEQYQAAEAPVDKKSTASSNNKKAPTTNTTTTAKPVPKQISAKK